MKTDEITTQEKPTYTKHTEEEIKLNNLLAIRDKETKKIAQIRFTSVNGVVYTHKPSIKTETRCSDLLEVIERAKEQPDITQLHKNIYKINQIVKSDDICVISSGFTEMQSVDKKGKKSVYYFFTEQDIENMKIKG